MALFFEINEARKVLELGEAARRRKWGQAVNSE